MLNLAVIDADSLSYLGSKDDTLQQILEKVDNKIHEILIETSADYYVLLVSKGKYFRHTISKSIDTPEGSYKSNRTYTTQPWVKTIKEYLIVKYKAVWYPNIEADDVAAWLMSACICVLNKEIEGLKFHTKPLPKSSLFNLEDWEEVNKILVAKDKDLLYSIPSKGRGHLNFSKKLGPDEWGMEWVETSINDASFYEWEVMVTGDQSDGIKGLYKKGKAWVDKNFANKSLREVQHLVFDEYIKDYGTSKGIFEFQKNYRLLHMLSTDEDMLREVGYIPQLPEFQQVSFKTTAEKLDDDLQF